MRRLPIFFLMIVCVGSLLRSRIDAQNATQPLGLFEGHTDVGTILHPGTVNYDSANRTYTITGSGENMWGATDAFQFVWKKVSGDVTITADISFLNKTGNEHKKGALILAPESGCGFRVCRRGLARQRAHVVAIPRREGRSDAGDPIQSLRSQTSPHRQARRLCLYVAVR